MSSTGIIEFYTAEHPNNPIFFTEELVLAEGGIEKIAYYIHKITYLRYIEDLKDCNQELPFSQLSSQAFDDLLDL